MEPVADVIKSKVWYGVWDSVSDGVGDRVSDRVKDRVWTANWISGNSANWERVWINWQYTI